MHEMSLCEGILQILEEQAKFQGYSRVKNVHLEVGALSGVEISALEFCFDVVVKDSIAQDAKLTIHEKPAIAWCMQCMQNVEISTRIDACPRCDSHQLQVGSGEEFKIIELEVV